MAYEISIEANLKRLFSIPRGSYPLFPKLGISHEFIDKKLTNANILTLKEQVLENIALYEPRLDVNKVKFIKKGESLTLAFAEGGIEVELN